MNGDKQDDIRIEFGRFFFVKNRLLLLLHTAIYIATKEITLTQN